MKARITSNSRITIDGRDFVGRSVQINGNKVIIDGVEQTGSLVGPVSVTIHGNVEKIETGSGDVITTGGAGSISTESGDIRCGNVNGDVKTTSGDVTCDKIAGNVKTVSGDIIGRASL
jgi:uncharacterized protein YjbJ (UPF0337 family)